MSVNNSHREEREVAPQDTVSEDNNCCGCLSLDKIPTVRGVNFNGYARAALSMSNIYMNSMLIYFSCKAGGGFGEGLNADRCVNPDVTVYGMKPAALISNLLVVTAVLSAILMPVFGAVIDYTRHRRNVGIVMSVALTVITAVQVGTNEVSVCCVILKPLVFMKAGRRITSFYDHGTRINI
jgi:hypothetical protein